MNNTIFGRNLLWFVQFFTNKLDVHVNSYAFLYKVKVLFFGLDEKI